jgi:hypothetical protein
MSAKFYYIFAISFLLFSIPSLADYFKTGQAKGTECKGIVIKLCESHNIDATEEDGQLYGIKEVWQSVDKYDAYRDTCTLYPKGNSSNIIAQAIYALKKPILLEHVGNKYNKIDADWVIFPCVKR